MAINWKDLSPAARRTMQAAVGAAQLPAETPKASKYKNVRSKTDDGLSFDSNAEKARYYQLLMLERGGYIQGLQRQVPFVLVPGVKLACNAKPSPPIRYVADFTYVEKGALVVEDVKGVRTDAYRIKRHLMKHVHGIDILETS